MEVQRVLHLPFIVFVKYPPGSTMGADKLLRQNHEIAAEITQALQRAILSGGSAGLSMPQTPEGPGWEVQLICPVPDPDFHDKAQQLPSH